MKGAGGTEGGIIQFFVGLIMLIGGGYLLLNSIRVSHHFGMGYSLYSFGSYNLTSGMVLIPFVFGVGIIFYNAKNILGWVLTISSIVMLVFGVISSINFQFKHMSAFDLLMMLGLTVGGLGTILNSLRSR